MEGRHAHAAGDGNGKKSFEEWLAQSDIEDMLAVPYPAGEGGRLSVATPAGRGICLFS